MEKKFKRILIVLVVVVGIVTLPNFINSSDGEKMQLSISTPQEDLVREVFSYPTGNYEGKVERITLRANGDIMFHGPQIEGAYKSGKYDFEPNFRHIKKYIESADLALGNFESTTAGGTPSGYPVFNAPDESLETLSKIGYDVLATANNHALDKGKNGVVRTIDKIAENNMVSVGTYKEPGENIYTAEVENIKIAVLSYTYGLNGMESLLSSQDREYMVNLIDKEKIKGDIKKSKENGADFTIVFIHWGNEYQLKPSSEQKELANSMFQWGADIILGSHPHVIQESDIVYVDGEAKYVIYSMGNFISNQRRETLGSIANSTHTEDGVIVELALEKDFISGDKRIVGVNYIPTWVNRTGSNGNFHYEVLPVRDALKGDYNDYTKAKLQASYENTMGKMELYGEIGANK
ncbi:CapA family protein [Alkalibaculum bacchi]|uniref:CapA family protein n=1 Tax=Alkalibaculum bacchi TaxID=645887 RepID=UPI0026EA78F2|nr:CapA family protein [Alkalibaculum bacchi]